LDAGDLSGFQNLTGLVFTSGAIMPEPMPLQFGQYYHIYNRGNGGENIFRETRNYGYFLGLYARHIEPLTETYAYCLLRNHFHLLVRINDERDLTGTLTRKPVRSLPQPSQAFSNFFNAYTKAINKTYGRTGNLFQRPFGRILVSTDQYFTRLIHYIHFNPQKHGFVADFREYPYSSYQTMLSAKPTRLKRETVLGWFNGAAAFETVHRAAADEKRIAALIGDDPD
jgi:REP element-mobilizing transposase RayT